MEKIHNIVYETTNLINGKIYRGVHCTDIINDGYIGSGIRLKTAIRKYGEENFKRTDIWDFGTAELAFWWEQYFIDEDFLKRDDVYNIKTGGLGSRSPSKEIRLKISNTLKERCKIYGCSHKGKKLTAEHKRKLSESHKGKHPIHTKEHTEKIRQKILGRKHTIEAIDKMREAHKGKIRSPEAIEKFRKTLAQKRKNNEHKTN